MRYSLRALLVLLAVVGAFLAGRVSNQSQIDVLKQLNAVQDGEIKKLQKQRTWLRLSAENQEKYDQQKQYIDRLQKPQEAEPGVYFLGPLNY